MFFFNSTDACSSFITSHDLSACNNGSRDGSSDSVSPQLDPFATSSMDPRFGFSSLVTTATTKGFGLVCDLQSTDFCLRLV